ncbi:MAG: primosomal protein N', partial [Clostridia bacterium]|nr:primosomal protein N' [Clostridia bacterium]
MTESIARTRIIDLPYQADRDYDYIIPAELSGTVSAGDILVVPFGRGNRKKYAVVRELVSEAERAGLKSVISGTGVNIPSHMLGLCGYMKDRFFCSFGEAARVMAPTYAIPGIREYYSPAPGITSGGGDPLLSFIVSKQSVSFQSLKKRFDGAEGRLAALVKEGLAEKELRLTEKRTVFDEEIILNEQYLKADVNSLVSLVQGRKQREILSFLHVSGREKLFTVCEICGATKKTVDSLVKAGFLTVISDEKYRDPYAGLVSDGRAAEPPVLTEEQKKAAERLCRLSGSPPSAALLYGVTGSGKTEVIGRVIDKVIKSGRSVILMLPEISLTPQTVGIFYRRYPDITAVLHSGLSDGERFDAWRRMSEGKCRLCIGTRSAVFAPVRNLGLIVMDEEQEHTYRSESAPKYHARDVARYRCASEKAMLLLSSATPSVGTFKKAREGRYELVTLGERFGGAKLPELVISDMRREPGLPVIGNDLKRRLAETLGKGEQAILYVGKRGYSSSLVCASCGRSPECPRCSVSFTHHVTSSGRGYLSCHWCGLKIPMPDLCPGCGQKSLRKLGMGTQLVEEKIKADFPSARVIRMDSDTTGTRSSYDEMISAFRNGKSDVLVGTQMITKGHDFPGVTLVGVIDADSELYRGDYASAERAFDLFTQVTGRAGRGKLPGTALIQTFSPNHPVINELTGGSYDQMFSREIEERRVRQFPPFCDIVIFTVSSTEEAALPPFSEKIAALLSDIGKNVPLAIFGPMN